MIIGICIIILTSGCVNPTDTEQTKVVKSQNKPGAPLETSAIYSPGFGWCPPCLCPVHLCPACRCPACPAGCVYPVFCPGTTTVILIRHAEKSEDGSIDPPLTTNGMARAKELVHVAGNANIAGIYASDAIRSRQTVADLSAQLHLKPIIYPYIKPGNFDAKADVFRNYSGQTVLIAGHTDNIPSIIQSFNADPSTCPLDAKFDNLCILIIPCNAGVKVIHLHYGAVS